VRIRMLSIVHTIKTTKLNLTTWCSYALLGKILSDVNFPQAGLGLVVSLVCAGVLLACAIPAAAPPSMPPEPPAAAAQEPITPIPLSLALDPPRVALGERLFHEVRLSHDNTRACATCHPLEQGGMDGRPRALAANGTLPLRNTPTVFNVGLNAAFNWDGIADTLEAHAEIVLLSSNLMNTTWPELLAKLQADPDYVTRFNTTYAGGLTPANVLDALASFERSLLTPNARFDRYLRGERHALTAPEQQGYRLFKSYGCVACHQGMNIGGNMYQKFGIFEETDGESPAAFVDFGRYAVTKVPRDRAVFRVPSLRNVAATAPYFHDGRAPTLEAAVDTMARVQLGRTLTPEEIGLVVRFLHTLTGEYHGRPVASSGQEHRDGYE
jgi:cytochrome c peroxidase